MPESDTEAEGTKVPIHLDELTTSVQSVVRFNDGIKDLRARNKNKQKNPSDITQRVIYARTTANPGGHGPKKEVISPEEGEAIPEALAIDLKRLCWGGTDKTISNIWSKQGLVFKPELKLFAYGLKMPKNETKNFLMCFQAYLLKEILFAEEDTKSNKKPGANNRRYKRGQKEEKMTDAQIEKKLAPKVKIQQSAIIEAILETLFKASGGQNATFCIVGPNVCFEQPQGYLNDNITEKLRLFTCAKKDDLRPVIKCFYEEMVKEGGIGMLMLLYSLLLSRGTDKVKEDLQDQVDLPMIDVGLGVISTALMNLIITGQATPYVHNSVGDDEKVGICGRNDIGLLISSENEESSKVGAYLKTPMMPIWLTKCEGNMGVLFNPSKDLLKSKGAETRFNLYYYSDKEFEKGETPKQTLLTVDSRAKEKEEEKDFDNTEVVPPALETAIGTKWLGAGIDWNDTEPYVW